MQNRRNYYRLLQVQPDAPLEVIRASYHTLMRELKQHPDLGGSSSHAALLNEAYKTLSNSTLREEYDKKLFSRYTKQSLATNTFGHHMQPHQLCPLCKAPPTRQAPPWSNLLRLSKSPAVRGRQKSRRSTSIGPHQTQRPGLLLVPVAPGAAGSNDD